MFILYGIIGFLSLIFALFWLTIPFVLREIRDILKEVSKQLEPANSDKNKGV